MVIFHLLSVKGITWGIVICNFVCMYVRMTKRWVENLSISWISSIVYYEYLPIGWTLTVQFWSKNLGFVLWHINHCCLFNAKSSLSLYIYIYIYIYMICKHFFRQTQLNNQTFLFKTIHFSKSEQSRMVPSIGIYYYPFQAIQFSVCHLFVLSLIEKTVLFDP